jgi:hypothetical protein
MVSFSGRASASARMDAEPRRSSSSVGSSTGATDGAPRDAYPLRSSEPVGFRQWSVDVGECFVERVGVVLGEELGDELGTAVDADLLEHRLDVVADGVR